MEDHAPSRRPSSISGYIDQVTQTKVASAQVRTIQSYRIRSLITYAAFSPFHPLRRQEMRSKTDTAGRVSRDRSASCNQVFQPIVISTVSETRMNGLGALLGCAACTGHRGAWFVLRERPLRVSLASRPGRDTFPVLIRSSGAPARISPTVSESLGTHTS